MQLNGAFFQPLSEHGAAHYDHITYIATDIELSRSVISVYSFEERKRFDESNVPFIQCCILSIHP